ncbi:MAG: hypothetical protein ACI4C1_04995 [Lachnospiraceae bacterium]
MLPVDEAVIVHILSDENYIIEDLHKKQLLLESLYHTTEADLQNSLLFPSQALRETPSSVRYSDKDLTDVSIQMEQEINRQKQLLKQETELISEQLIRIQRIRVCYQALPEKWRDILHQLYIEHKKWSCLPYSSSQISRIRRKALNQIMEWYQSNLSDVEIIIAGNQKSLELLVGRSLRGNCNEITKIEKKKRIYLEKDCKKGG